MNTVVITSQNIFERKIEKIILYGEVLGIKKGALKILIPPTKNEEFTRLYKRLDCKNRTSIKADENEYFGEIGYSSETNIISLLLKSEPETFEFPKEIIHDIR